MSLLLDALRRAEAAKRRHGGGEDAAPVEPGFPQLDAEAVRPGSAPDMSLSQDEPVRPANAADQSAWTLAEQVAPSRASEPAELTLEGAPSVPAPEKIVDVASEPTIETAPPVEPATRQPLFEKAAPSLYSGPPPAASPAFDPATAKPAEPTPVQPPPASREPRETAKRVVAASRRPRAPVNRTLLLALVGGLAVLCAAAYLWWQMQPPGSVTLFGTPPPTQAAPGEAASEATSTAVLPAASAPSPATPMSSAEPVSPPTGAVAGRTAPPERLPVIAAEAKPVAVAPVPARQAQRERSEPPAVRFIPAQAETGVLQQVRRGFAAYQAGNLQVAAVAYQEALVDDPASRDAMLGLAAIAARQGRAAEAQRWYQRLLDMNPQDPDAQAGLLAVGRNQPPAEREARLRSLIETQPERAELMQELAGLYASQQRWAEAQQAYFQAFTLDNDNPDAAFNLALSLEHIDQPKAALDYYRKALTLAQQRTPHFQPVVAEQRVAALTREGTAKR